MSTTIYEKNYEKLSKLFKMEDLSYNSTIVLKSNGFMDLNIDLYAKKGDGSFIIAVDHHYIQNSDLMRDPEMLIWIYPKTKMAEALTYRQDGLGINQEVYEYDDNGNRTHVYPKLKKDLNIFLGQWLRNLKIQGFYESVPELVH